MTEAGEKLWRCARELGQRAGLVVAVLVSIGIGWLLHAALGPAWPSAGTQPAGAAGGHPAEAPTVWTCSMHPQVRRPGPGKCPLCAMDLVRVARRGAGGPRELSVSPAARALMDVETAAVERRFVEASLRMVGKVDYDETKLAYITAWVPGRLDKLYVDYTGVPVRKGDHMVSIYSPELLGAQEELLAALKAVKALARSDVGIVRATAEATVTAVREKLRLLGLTGGQIANIEKTGKASDHLTLYSRSSGIVLHKHAQEGMYVNTGSRIYTIADLTGVWVKLDAYESDLMWLRYGQRVEFTTVSYPGETFAGTIAFIDPILTARTRTVKLRVNAPNASGRLKPGMFVKAVVRARVAAAGRVMDPDLAGKWMCPMHPDIVKPAAGTCDLCKMPLVRTESLGYVSAQPSDAEKPLVIPASAVLKTGTRAVVYVARPGTDKPTYEGREVVLGPRAGEFYLVRRGLTEGERVVVRGGFKIDSALQILARPAMMSPPPGGRAKEPPGPAATAPAVGAEFRRQLGLLFEKYLAMQRGLASDKSAEAGAAAAGIAQALAAVDAGLLAGADRAAWARHAAELSKTASAAAKAKAIQPQREAFSLLSEQMLAVARRFGPPAETVYRMKCPMAFSNRGAVWLQSDRQVRNPYFGAAMLRCGQVVEAIPARPQRRGGGAGHGHAQHN